MKRHLTNFLLPALFLLAACSPKQNTGNALLVSQPEKQGVSSEAIIRFIDAMANSPHELHGFVFIRHGNIIAEGWNYPYSRDLRHTLYSTSKSFTSTAVGFAVTEKKLSLDDKVISFFPDDLPDSVSPNLAAMRVRDLITMSAGQDPDPTFQAVTQDSNWAKAFLAVPVLNQPGTKFLYNSLATYMLSAIVQKVTGEKVLDYLTPRLFEPLGISGMDWEVDAKGINTGGWGLRLHTNDMARFGQLLLQKGDWNGKQLIPAEWVNDATKFKIDQNPAATPAQKDSSDWLQGYCYQFWRCRNNAFRADGAYGQYIIVMPEQDAVIAIQSESPDMQAEINLVWEYLLPAMQAQSLPENKEKADELAQKLTALALPLPAPVPEPVLATAVSGKNFTLTSNPLGWEGISFSFKNGQCQTEIKAEGVQYPLLFGNGTWIQGATPLPGPNLLSGAIAHGVGLPAEKTAGCYTWTGADILELTHRYIESPHTRLITCRFKGDDVVVEVKNSQDFGTRTTTITGKAK
jgi:CubicO group peptidase (beta-lactamase class C family)